MTTIQPRGGSYEANFSLSPAVAIVTSNSQPLESTTSYIVISYDNNLKVVNLAAR